MMEYLSRVLVWTSNKEKTRCPFGFFEKGNALQRRIYVASHEIGNRSGPLELAGCNHQIYSLNTAILLLCRRLCFLRACFVGFSRFAVWCSLSTSGLCSATKRFLTIEIKHLNHNMSVGAANGWEQSPRPPLHTDN
eukprot:scaffold42600_cov191-Amphora_coffeaeformis.AAC.1